MLTAHHLRITLNVETPIELSEHPGKALRGMLFNALRGPQHNPALGFCTQRHLTTCADCALVAVCPVAALVATMNPQAERGRDIPRPYVILPPTSAQTRYEAGGLLTFGLTLFGQALNLFPYVVMALRQAGPGGLGKKLPHPTANQRPRRGRFQLHSAQAMNLLTGEVQDILEADNPIVRQPDLPVTHSQVVAASQLMLAPIQQHATNGHQAQAAYLTGTPTTRPLDFTLTFKTPTRIIEHKQLLKAPNFSPIFHRLLNRLMTLSREFGPQTAPAHRLDGDHHPAEPALAEAISKNSLLALADQVELIDDRTYWQELWSYSTRKGNKSPISGLMGQAIYRAPSEVWAKLLPYLLWGTIIHVGKNAVKGDGVLVVSG